MSEPAVMLSEAAIQVRDALIECGLETPMTENKCSPAERKVKIEAHMRAV